MYWVKLTPNVLFYPAQIGLFLTQCFLEYAEFVQYCAAPARNQSRLNFFVLFYKKANLLHNKGSYHVWSILQKFRGFKLICKYYFMHKEKKANIIIETNKTISWVKSSINDGLNKQSNLLGKINPKCTLLPSPNWVVFNPGFSRVDGRKLHSIFFLILQKSKDNFFFIECTQIKADLLQFRLSSWRGVASTVGRGINPVIAPARMRTHLSFLPNAACSLSL